MKCRICRDNNLKLFLSLGKSPLANSFLSKEDLEKKEPKYPLELVYCPKCKLVQLSYVVPPELMFKNYVYVTSTTKTLQDHFSKMADDVSKEFSLYSNSLVVDIGSNDGLLLKGFQKHSVQTIGVEPAANLAETANKNNIETVNDFFRKKAVDQILEKKGKADVVSANNVFAHIDDIEQVVRNVKLLLKEEGTFIIEFQYFMDMMERMTFDNIYHEHLSYYTLTSLVYFFEGHNMTVFKAVRVDTHGGSLRVFIKKGKHGIQKSVREILDFERKNGVNELETYEDFAKKVYLLKEKITSYIKSLKSDGKRIAAYGAPAKATTLLNFFQIGSFIDYIIEDNPLKMGLYAPGTHIPIKSSKILDENLPDFLLILAWNFAEEILEKTEKYAERVKFIIPLPELKVV